MEDDKKTFISHRALRNRVEELREHNVCLISYRITAPETEKKIKDSLYTKNTKDDEIQRQIDNLYMGKILGTSSLFPEKW